MKSKFFFLMLFVAAIATGCSNDDDDKASQPSVTGATMSATVVFAPGQLGDMGFADNVLEGVYRLKVLDHQLQPDTLDVNYLAGSDLNATKAMVEDWFDNVYNTYTNQLYKRRLLVLTEPFMVDWVEPLKAQFNEWDEVLVMKMNKDDVAKAAQRLGLGSRLHGLNISAAASARRYYQYILQSIEEDEENHYAAIENGDEDAGNYKRLNCKGMLYFRLYDPEQVTQRDSIYEVLNDSLGEAADIIFNSLSTTVGDGIFSDEGQTSILQEAYKYGQTLTEQYDDMRSAFHVADLGSAAQGLGYYFMGKDMNIKVLMLDTQITNMLCIRRDFGTAFYNWTAQWMRSDAIGTMPAIQEFGDWNSNYVTDNIELNDENE